MSGIKIWFLVFLVVGLSLGCLLGVGALVDVLTYRDMQRRLREERRRKEAGG